MATRKLKKIGSFKLESNSPKDEISVLENKYLLLPKEFLTSNLNILDLETGMLPDIIMMIFKIFISRTYFVKVSPLSLKEFIIDISDSYLEVPYHNLHHATAVLHTTYVLLDGCKLFNTMDSNIIFAVLIAALTHDVGHPGNNNQFEVNTFSELAFRYNDMSVLEQHHCSVTFEIIKKHNLHSLLTPDEFKTFRKTIVSCILGTDMSHHKAMTEALEKRSHFELSSIDDQIEIGKYVLHAADIGNPILMNHLCEQWSRLVAQEFHEQIIKEKLLGLPPFSSLDISCDVSFLTSEIGFITYVCKPYWSALNKKFSSLSDYVNRIDENLNIFKERLEKIKKENLKGVLDQYC